MDYRKLFKRIEVVDDRSRGVLKLSLMERFGQDRKTKLKSNYLGQTGRASGETLSEIFIALNNILPDKIADELIIGLESSGMICAAALAEARDTDYNYSTNYNFLGHDDALFYSESHRNEKPHHLYGVSPGDTVVVIEDEVWSGNGMTGLIDALIEYGVNIRFIVSVVEVVNFGAREKIESKGLDYYSLTKIKLH